MMLLMGHLSHILLRLRDENLANNKMSLIQLIQSRPIATVTGIIGSLSGYLMLSETGQLTAVAAWGVGFAADKLIETLSARSFPTIKK